MKIQTTEAVRRFNAQIELADIALSKWFDVGKYFNLDSPETLHRCLFDNKYYELAGELLLAGKALGYFREPGQSPDNTAASSPTKSACQHNNMVLNDSKEFAWKCADCGYVYGKEDSTAQLISDLERSKEKRTSGNWDGLHQMDNLVDRACEELKRFTNWREFCKHSARPGDIANVILQRDEMRTALKQCRKALLNLDNVELAEEALDRIYSIIPGTEL